MGILQNSELLSSLVHVLQKESCSVYMRTRSKKYLECLCTSETDACSGNFMNLHSNYSQILAYKKDQNMKKCFHVIDMAQDASVLLSVVSVDSLTIQTNFQSIVLPEKQTNI